MSTMTMSSCEIHVPAIPRRAVLISLAVHAAALLLLPGLGREVKELELPPLMATLRLVPPAEPAASTPTASLRPATPQPQAPAKPVHREEKQPTPVITRNDKPAPAAAAAAAAPSMPSSAERVVQNDSAPAPVAPPVPAPVASVAPDPGALDEYGRILSDLLARQQQYPRLAAMRGWEGEVRLKLTARKGSLVAVQVVRSSGHEVLDQHALQMVQGASLPPPPDKIGDREIQVVVPIHYKLNKPT